MSFSYHWSLGQTLFRRKFPSSARVILSVCAATLLGIAALVGYFQAEYIIKGHMDSVTLSIILPPDVPQTEIEGIRSDIYKLSPMVRMVSVRTPDSVKAYFNKQFSVDMGEVLPTNPFPLVISITFYNHMLSWQSFEAMVQQCRNIGEISYRSDYIRAVFNEVQMLRWVGILGGLVIFVIIFLILYYSIRSEMVYSTDDAKINHLLGETRSPMRISNIARGFWCGILGALTASTIGILTLMYTEQVHFTSIWNIVWLPLVISSTSCLLLTMVLSYSILPKTE